MNEIYRNMVYVEEAETIIATESWQNHTLVLTPEKNSIAVNEVISLKVELVASDGTRTDLTERVMIANYFPELSEIIDGNKLRGIQKGETLLRASIGNWEMAT